MRRLAAALPLALLSACTLLVDVGGLSNGADAKDAAASGEGGGAGLDPGSEGGADAASDSASGSSGSPCTKPHAFCDDFDMGSPDVTNRWDVLHSTAGPLSLDTTQSRSPPRALRMHLTPTTGNKDSQLSKDVPVKNGTGRVELDMFMPTPMGPWTEVDPIGVQISPAPAGYDFHGVFLVVRGDGSFFQYFAAKKGGNVDTRAPITPISYNVWHHIVVTFSYATTPPKGTLTIDTEVVSVDMAVPLPTTLEVQLGASYTENTNLDWSLYFDNVAIDTP